MIINKKNDTSSFELTNHNSIKVPNVFEPTLGTSYGPMSPPYMNKSTKRYKDVFESSLYIDFNNLLPLLIVSIINYDKLT